MLKRLTPVLVVEGDLRRAGLIASALLGAPGAKPIRWVFGPADALALLSRGFRPLVILLGDPLTDESSEALVRRVRGDPRLARAFLLVLGRARLAGKRVKRERWLPERCGSREVEREVRSALASARTERASDALAMGRARRTQRRAAS